MKTKNLKRLLRRTILWTSMTGMDKEMYMRELASQVVKLEKRVQELEARNERVTLAAVSWEDHAENLYGEKPEEETK